MTKDSMLKHESICFGNPDRKCPVCSALDHEGELDYSPISEKVALVIDSGEEALRTAVHCRACCLAAIFQANKNPEMTEKLYSEHDYKKEIREQFPAAVLKTHSVKGG